MEHRPDTGEERSEKSAAAWMKGAMGLVGRRSMSNRTRHGHGQTGRPPAVRTPTPDPKVLSPAQVGIMERITRRQPARR